MPGCEEEPPTLADVPLPPRLGVVPEAAALGLVREPPTPGWASEAVRHIWLIAGTGGVRACACQKRMSICRLPLQVSHKLQGNV